MVSHFLPYVLLAGLLRPAWAGEPYPDREEVCVSACEHTLDKQSFLSTGAADEEADAQPCTNALHVQSLYICAKQYCKQQDIKPGWDFLSHLCSHEGYPGLPALSSFSDVSLAEVKAINATSKNKMLNTTVLANTKFWDLVLESTIARAQARWTNRSHQEAIYIFWGIIMGLAAVFNLGSKFSVDPPAFASGVLRPVQASLSIPLLLTRRAQPVPSRLEAPIIAAFFVLSLILCAVSIDLFPGSWIYVSFKDKGDQAQMLSLVARRCGDMAVANIALIWLFSMRNNPLIMITGWGFATFNQFHRWVARVTFLELIVHACVFTKYQFVKGGLARYKYVYQQLKWWRMGFMAIIFLFLILAFSAAPLRARFYDSFLLMHILMAVVFFTTLWYHVEAQFFLQYLWPVVAIWPLERVLRFVRLFIAGSKGMATVSVDDSAGLLRIDASSVFGKRRPTPGSTYYIYSPTRFPFYQSHPFTLVAFPSAAPDTTRSAVGEKQTDNVTVQPVPDASAKLNYRFLITQQKGFTKKLFGSFAKLKKANGEETSSQRLPVLLEGPYQEEAHTINFHSCKDVILVIGGSGISVALSSIYKALSIREVSSVKLVWSARQRGMMQSVADEELKFALRDSRFTLEAHVTQSPADCTKEVPREQPYPLTYSRPNVFAVIQEHALNGSGRLGIIACGPQGMLSESRKAIAIVLRNRSRDVDVSVSSFGW